MSGPTTGDRIWYAVLQLLSEQESLTVADVLAELDDPPARQTVYRRLEAMCSVGNGGFLQKEPGRGSAPTVYYDPDAAKRPDGGPAIVHSEPHRLAVHNVGGREPDGNPTYIGPWTFDTKLVRDVVERWLKGRVLNACAGKTRLSHSQEVVRNDINPEREADHHTDVRAITDLFSQDSFDTVVFDPPFDQTQADDHYGGMHDRERGPARRKLAALVRPGGIFIECGWNDHGPALADDCWRREECHRYRRGPSYQPMFLTVDRRETRQTTLQPFTR
jgi:hypothetical protein